MTIKLVEFIKTPDDNLQVCLTESGRESMPEVIEMRDLTSSIVLTDEAEHDESGILARCSRVFWHPNYAIEDPIETLRTTGHFVLEGAE
jgi:hypothetical protein